MRYLMAQKSDEVRKSLHIFVEAFLLRGKYLRLACFFQTVGLFFPDRLACFPAW